MDEKNKSNSVPSTEYTREYFEFACDGYEEFSLHKGSVIPKRLSIPIDLANIKVGNSVLDIGCGRGEILLQSINSGAMGIGVDYSVAAVKITQQNLKSLPTKYQNSFIVNICDAMHLPLKSESIDIVFMLDVVEHLYPEELENTYSEVWRVLKHGGKLIIHTMPNIWYYKYIYPLFRMIQKSRGIDLPTNPRDRWPFIHVHVNEQSPMSLYKSLRHNGFKSKVWLESTQNYDKYNVNNVMKSLMKILSNTIGFNYLFCNDIFALATKQKRE